VVEELVLGVLEIKMILIIVIDPKIWTFNQIKEAIEEEGIIHTVQIFNSIIIILLCIIAITTEAPIKKISKVSHFIFLF
jgi:hypothetical protein